MAAAPAAAEAPAVVLFAVSAVAIVTAMSLVMLRFSTVVLVGGLLRALTFGVSWIPWVGSASTGATNKVIHAVDKALGEAISASQAVATRTFHDAWKITTWTAREIALLAEDTAAAVQAIVTSHVPLTIAASLGPLTLAIETLREAYNHLNRHTIPDAIRQAEARAAATTRATIGRLEGAVAHAAAGAVAIPGTVGWTVPDVLGWARGKLAGVNARLTRLEKLVGLGALTGVLLNVIAREIPWVRCRNMNRLGKELCGTPVQDFENLLGSLAFDALALYTLLDLVEFAHEMQSVIGYFDTGIRALVGVAPLEDFEALLLDI